MRSRILSAACLCAMISVAVASAEPTGSFLYVAPVGGFTQFDEDYRLFPSAAPLTDDVYFGGRLGFQLRTWVALELAGGFTPTAEDAPGGKEIDHTHGSGNLVFTPFAARWGGPFLSVGGGASQYKTTDGDDRDRQGNAEFAAGANVWLSDVVGLRIEARDILWLPKDEPTSPETSTLVFGGGLVFAIGAQTRDTDGDGIPDRRDQCADTPKGAIVDPVGCPVDADKDGVFDGIDQCSATPRGATVDARGCPADADADSVLDGIDQCADTPRGATVDARGCPADADADSVLDGMDQCPDTPRGAHVDPNGCPIDSDGDGIPEGIDKCPGTTLGLRVDKDGCPIEISEKETELLDTGMIRLQGVNFSTGKAEISPEGMAALDMVGEVLIKWPELRIEIGGHTDSRGSNATNQKLSQSRVNAGLDYLLKKFPQLKREMFTTKGYGESAPLVPNTSALNMSKNRRVEFKVLNRETLRREVERRKLLRNE